MSKDLIHYNNIIHKAFTVDSNIKDEFVFFLREKLDFKDNDIFINKEKILTDVEENLIKDFIKKKLEGIPLDYILNSTKFYEEDFYIDERVLIPRPETELLVDFINNQNFPQRIKVLDAGTGSGCIGISIALKNPKFDVYGLDYSMDSLYVANINKDNLHVDNFFLIHSDWLTCFNDNSFDVIVSNPPYISEDDLHLDNLIHEPNKALVSSNNGLADIKKITQQSTRILQKGGMLLFEHGFNQSNEVNNILEANGFLGITSLEDFQSHPRATLGIL